MVEKMLAARGISVTHETIWQWGLKFGRNLPTASVGERLAVATNGTSMRCSGDPIPDWVSRLLKQ